MARMRLEDFSPDAQRRIKEALDAEDNHSGSRDPQPELAEQAALVGQVSPEDILGASAPRLLVTITRVAPRKLDDDNFVGGAKQLRDAIAERLGRKGDAEEDGLVFQYGQRQGKVRQTIITIQETEDGD